MLNSSIVNRHLDALSQPNGPLRLTLKLRWIKPLFCFRLKTPWATWHMDSDGMESITRQFCTSGMCASLFISYRLGLWLKKAQIKENHRLCFKRLRPSLWLGMDEVRQCFTTAVRRRLLVGITEMNFVSTLRLILKCLDLCRQWQRNSFRLYKAHTGKADITNLSLADSRFKSESTKSAKHSSMAKLTRSHSSRQHPVTRSSSPNQRYSSKCDPFCRLFNLTFFFCCLGYLH